MRAPLRALRFLHLLCWILSFVALEASARITPSAPLNAWVQSQRDLSWKRLLLNISAPGTAPGTVLASPSKEAPNYWFHWVRDAGLVLDQVVARRTQLTGPEADALDQILWDFTALSRRQQKTANRSGAADERGLGEPKFEVNGEPFVGDWGRPQNDSPAARALMLVRWAQFLLDQPGKEALHARVRRELYDGKLPSDSVIKNDLEYVATHAQDPCIDLWEETWGFHFYTRALSESALVEGAQLARRLGDPFAADWYEKKAELLRKALAEHWNPAQKFLVITRDKAGLQAPVHPRFGAIALETREWKPSGLDSAVILAILHRRDSKSSASGRTDLSWSVLDPRVRMTFQKLETTFKALYPINSTDGLAPGIGRYPEDKYDGVETGSQGHAWVLATAGFAEFLFRSAQAEMASASTIGSPSTRDRIEGLLDQAEAYVARLQKHSSTTGNWSEQIHRVTGEQRGARDLSWSHAAFLSMAAARDRAWQRFSSLR